MKKKFYYIVILILFSKSISGQSFIQVDSKTTDFIANSQLECIYDYKIVAPKRATGSESDKIQMTTNTYKTVLQANASVSKFWDWHTFEMDSIQFSTTQQLSQDSLDQLDVIYNRKIRCLFLPVIVKNYPIGKITVIDKIVQDDYIYQEDKIDKKWTLSYDTLTVCGYHCSKAETSIGGRKWTVWYAPEIAMSDGPWKLSGLPGLILKAIDSTKTHTFEAIVIRNSKDPMYLKKDITPIKISRKDFYKNRNYFEGETLKTEYLSEEQKQKMYVSKGVFYIDNQRTNWNTLTKNSPLEFE